MLSHLQMQTRPRSSYWCLPPLETQTAPPSPSPGKSSCMHLSWEKTGHATIYLLFTFACDVPPLCSVSLCSFGEEELLIVSKCPITPTLMSSLLVSSSTPLIPCVELAFSEMGVDSSIRCWITAVSRHSTPPQRQQKGRLLCLSGGKQLGTDDAGQADLRDHSYDSDKVLFKKGCKWQTEDTWKVNSKGKEKSTNTKRNLVICLGLKSSLLSIFEHTWERAVYNKGISAMSHTGLKTHHIHKHIQIMRWKNKHAKQYVYSCFFHFSVL